MYYCTLFHLSTETITLVSLLLCIPFVVNKGGFINSVLIDVVVSVTKCFRLHLFTCSFSYFIVFVLFLFCLCFVFGFWFFWFCFLLAKKTASDANIMRILYVSSVRTNRKETSSIWSSIYAFESERSWENKHKRKDIHENKKYIGRVLFSVKYAKQMEICS